MAPAVIKDPASQQRRNFISPFLHSIIQFRGSKGDN